MVGVRRGRSAPSRLGPQHRWCCEHSYSPADDLCAWCGRGFCVDCLVFPFGSRRPPYCIRCAVEAAGVRRSGRRQVRTWSDRVALQRRRAALARLERPVRPDWLDLPPIHDHS